MIVPGSDRGRDTRHQKQHTILNLYITPEQRSQRVSRREVCCVSQEVVFAQPAEKRLLLKKAWWICTSNVTTAAVDSLQAFPFLSSPLVLTSLKQELPTYLAKAADTSDEVEPLTWWKKYSVHLPNRSSAARKVALVQPSSAAAERVFSILNSTFGAQQEQSLQD